MTKTIRVKVSEGDPKSQRPRSFAYCPLTLKGGREYKVPQQISEVNAALMIEHGDAEVVGIAGTLKKKSTKIKTHAGGGETVVIKPAAQVEDERDDGKSRGSISQEEK